MAKKSVIQRALKRDRLVKKYAAKRAELAKIKDMGATAAIVMHYGGNDWSRAQIEGLKAQFKVLGIEAARGSVPRAEVARRTGIPVNTLEAWAKSRRKPRPWALPGILETIRAACAQESEAAVTS